MLKEGNFQRYLQEGRKADNSENNARKIFESGSAFIKKFKVEANKKNALLYPLELVVPFNPQDLSDASYNESNPFIFAGAVSDAIVYLKSRMKEDAEFNSLMLNLLSLNDASVLHLEDAECSGIEEAREWHKLCRPFYITGYVQGIKGVSDKFPRKMGINPIFDDNGAIIGSTGVGYNMNLLENELLALQIEEVNKQYSPKGIHADASDDERESAIKTLRQNRIISNPFLQAYTLIISFPQRNSEGNMEQAIIETWLKSKKINQYRSYIKFTKEHNDLIVANLCSKKYDNSIDFFELRLDVPEEDPADKMNIYKAKPALVSRDCSIFNEENTSKEFTESVRAQYRATVSNTSEWNTDTLRRSVMELRLKSDADISAIVKNAISKYEIGLKNNTINSKYRELLDTIDSELVASFAEATIDGDTNDNEVNQEIINSLPVSAGYGDDADNNLLDGDNLKDAFNELLDSNDNENF